MGKINSAVRGTGAWGAVTMASAVTGALLLLPIPSVSAAEPWDIPAAEAGRTNPQTDVEGAAERGAATYRKLCRACHGATGAGDGALGKRLPVPPPNLPERVPTHRDGEVAWQIAEGRGAMPAWKEKLSAAEIWDLVVFLRSGLAAPAPTP